MRLKNGATELARYSTATRTYVAAKWHGVMPYVTWAVDDDNNAYWGHYFATEQEALNDLKKRT